MRSLKSGLVAIALSAICGTAAVVGCSANGEDSGIGLADTPTEPTPDMSSGGSVVPPRSDSGTPDKPGDAGKSDSGKKDAGPKPDAAVDAGPPPPVVGAACPTLNAIGSKKCGACGTAETVCLDDGSGKGKWSDYGACNNELAGGCIPGTMVQEDCGNCGKVTKTCTQYCAYTSGACTGQPMNSCAPGAVDYTNAGCPAQNYHSRTCGAACTWGNYSASCGAPENANKLTIAGSVNGTVSGNYTLSAAKMGPKVTGSCPGGTVSSTTDHPYEIVEVKNATAQTAKISAWLTGTPAIDTVMFAYNTNLPPQNDTQRKACSVGVNDFCPSSLPCSADDDWSGLTGTQAITIPPGQVVLIQFQAYYEQSSSSTTTGPATLTVRTDSLM